MCGAVKHANNPPNVVEDRQSNKKLSSCHRRCVLRRVFSLGFDGQRCLLLYVVKCDKFCSRLNVIRCMLSKCTFIDSLYKTLDTLPRYVTDFDIVGVGWDGGDVNVCF